MAILMTTNSSKILITPAFRGPRFLQATRQLCAIVLLAVSGMTATAEEPNSRGAPLTAEEARQKLLQARPDLPITSIRKSHLEGYYEVKMPGGPTLHMDDRAEYFFAGDLFLISPDGLVNATEMEKVDHRKEMLGSLSEKDMIIYAPRPELTRATVTVFTDIDCGYCRKLHLEVPELNRLGIAVRYLAFPRAGIGSESYEKAVSAWCAENPQIALTQAKSGKEIEHKTCANPVAEQYSLAAEFGVDGTPAVIYENGVLQGGYLPAAETARRVYDAIN